MKTLILVIFAALIVLVAGNTAHPECPDVCPAVFKPVCGSRCRCACESFSNLCELKRHNCKHSSKAFNFVKKGSCPRKCNFFSYYRE